MKDRNDHANRTEEGGAVGCCLLPHPRSWAGLFVEPGELMSGAFLGNLASVGDEGRLGITLALNHAPQKNLQNFCIPTDSMTGLNTAINLPRGAPHRSGIEPTLKEVLIRRKGSPTANAWIRSKIRIQPNVQADLHVEFLTSGWSRCTPEPQLTKASEPAPEH